MHCYNSIINKNYVKIIYALQARIYSKLSNSNIVTDCGNDPATDPDQLNQLANGLIKEPIKHQLDHGEQDSRSPKGCSDKDQLPPVDDPIHPLGDCQTTESTKEISPTYDI